MIKEDKRAQGLSITAIILIVLGILVLVILILGFTMGWDKIVPFINPPNNVQDVAEICNLKCSQDAEFDYCSQPREVNLDKETSEAVDLPTEIKATCYQLANRDELEKLGIEKCAGLCDVNLCTDLESVPASGSPGQQGYQAAVNAKICIECSSGVAPETGTFDDLLEGEVCCKETANTDCAKSPFSD